MDEPRRSTTSLDKNDQIFKIMPQKKGHRGIATSGETENHETPPHSRSDPLNVLVVDDLDTSAETLELLVGHAGSNYRPIRATSGAEAIRIARAVRIDVAITDWVMPEMSGTELLQELKAINPATVVFLISGYSTGQHVAHAFECGANDFLSKPISFESVRQMLQWAIESRKDESSRLRKKPLARLKPKYKKLLLPPEATLTSTKEMATEDMDFEMLQNTTAAFIHKFTNDLGRLSTLILHLPYVDPTMDPEIRKKMKEAIIPLEREGKSIRYLLERFRNILGRHPGLMRPIVIDDVLSSVADHLREIAMGKLILDLKTSPQRVKGDYELLWHLFENVMRNGLEAISQMRNGCVSVASSINRSGSRVKILIRDNGPGIAADALSEIFKPSYTTKSGGLGIGLYLARRSTALHLGSIRCSSGARRGATFTILLPTFKS